MDRLLRQAGAYAFVPGACLIGWGIAAATATPPSVALAAGCLTAGAVTWGAVLAYRTFSGCTEPEAPAATHGAL